MAFCISNIIVFVRCFCENLNIYTRCPCASCDMSQCCVKDSWLGYIAHKCKSKGTYIASMVFMHFKVVIFCSLYVDDADLLVVASETMSANNSSTPIETCFLAGTVYGYSTRFSIYTFYICAVE